MMALWTGETAAQRAEIMRITETCMDEVKYHFVFHFDDSVRASLKM